MLSWTDFLWPDPLSRSEDCWLLGASPHHLWNKLGDEGEELRIIKSDIKKVDCENMYYRELP